MNEWMNVQSVLYALKFLFFILNRKGFKATGICDSAISAADISATA